MRFAIRPLVVHRKSQFGPAGNDVLIQVAPFRCPFFEPNDAVQAFLQAYVPCLKARTVLSGPRPRAVLLIGLLFLFLLAVVLGILPLTHFLSVTRCRSPEECAPWYSIRPKDAEPSAENMSNQLTDKNSVVEQTQASVPEMMPPLSISPSDRLLRRIATLLFLLVAGMLTVFGSL
jgi:hypothetical protein